MCLLETNRIFSRINNLTFETRKTVLPKQVFVIQRGKGECEDFLSFIIRLNQRQSPSAPLVSKEIETDFFCRRFSKSRGSFPKGQEVRTFLKFVEVGGLGLLGCEGGESSFRRKFVKFVS